MKLPLRTLRVKRGRRQADGTQNTATLPGSKMKSELSIQLHINDWLSNLYTRDKHFKGAIMGIFEFLTAYI